MMDARAEANFLRTEMRLVCEAIGDRFLLDPPDGGSVTAHEGVSRAMDALKALEDALRAEEEWRARDAVGELNPDWDYEVMVGSKRRAALALLGGA